MKRIERRKMINTGVKETLCTHCSHRKVCKHSQDYLSILKVVEIYDFINGIDVGCKYYGNLLMEGEDDK